MSFCLKTSAGFLEKKIEEKRCSESISTSAEKPAECTRWLKGDAERSGNYFMEQLAIRNEQLEKEGWVKREMSSFVLRRMKVKAIEEMQRGGVSR